MAKRKVEETKRKKRYKNMMQRRRQRNSRDNKKKNNAQLVVKHIQNYSVYRKKAHAKKRFEKLLDGKYVRLNGREYSDLGDKDFMNNQNYITSFKNKYSLYFYSKEEVYYRFTHGKILLRKIDKSIFEKTFLKVSNYYFMHKTLRKNNIYLCNKYLYLVKKK